MSSKIPWVSWFIPGEPGPPGTGLAARLTARPLQRRVSGASEAWRIVNGSIAATAAPWAPQEPRAHGTDPVLPARTPQRGSDENTQAGRLARRGRAHGRKSWNWGEV